MADAESLSVYLRVPRAIVPADPDRLENPKRALVDIARRSRLAAIRQDMVPGPGMTSRVGPAYSSRVSEFARLHWRAEVASGQSDSLRRCIGAVRSLRLAFEEQPKR